MEVLRNKYDKADSKCEINAEVLFVGKSSVSKKLK